jgi:uncharacterized membrane protein YhaH (DUF805 family)
MFEAPFSFEGRIRRLEYGISIIMYTACYFISFLLASAISPFFFVLMIPVIWFLWAQGAKRCHDRNNSGWYQLIPFYGLWMLFAEGDSGENYYGDDPKSDNKERVPEQKDILDSGVNV